MRFIILLFLFTNFCTAEPTIARVTYYWGDDNTSTGKKPQKNKTIAVDPKIIKYGSEVFIPQINKTFIASDTGPAVKSRLASRKLGKTNIVVDIYCETKKEALTYIKKYPMFMEVRIKKLEFCR